MSCSSFLAFAWLLVMSVRSLQAQQHDSQHNTTLSVSTESALVLGHYSVAACALRMYLEMLGPSMLAQQQAVVLVCANIGVLKCAGMWRSVMQLLSLLNLSCCVGVDCLACVDAAALLTCAHAVSHACWYAHVRVLVLHCLSRVARCLVLFVGCHLLTLPPHPTSPSNLCCTAAPDQPAWQPAATHPHIPGSAPRAICQSTDAVCGPE